VTPEVLVGVGAALVVLGLAPLAAAYAYPPTRPLVRRTWWLIVVPFALAGGVILDLALRGQRRTELPRIPGPSSTAADEALARAADADAELARRRLAAKALDSRGQHLEEFDDRVARARAISDPVARRAALVAAVEGR
jgi:hypothetical protein